MQILAQPEGRFDRWPPHDVRGRLSSLSLDGAGITAVLTALAGFAGGPVALYTGGGLQLRAASEPVADGLPRRLRLSAAVLAAGARGLPLKAHGRRAEPADVVPVAAGGGDAALVALLPASGVEEAHRQLALEHGAEVLAFELARERAAAAAEQRLLGDFVERLLAGGMSRSEAERVAREAERLGSLVPGRGRALVVAPDGDAGAGSWPDGRVEAALLDAVRRRLPGALLRAGAGEAVLLVPEALAADRAAAERAARAIQAAAAGRGSPTVSVGIGDLAASVQELARSHREAREALRLARRAGGPAQVVSYRSLGAFRLLLQVQSPDALRGFVDEVLGPLLRYSRRTPLLETLDALVAARWVRSATARQLGIHINSLNYRLARVERLSGLSLDDAEARISLTIALRARTML